MLKKKSENIWNIRQHQVDMMFNGPDRPMFMSSQNNIIILFNETDRLKTSTFQNNNNVPI